MSPAGPVTQQPVAAPKQHSLTTTAEEPEVKKTNAKTNTCSRYSSFMTLAEGDLGHQRIDVFAGRIMHILSVCRKLCYAMYDG